MKKGTKVSYNDEMINIEDIPSRQVRTMLGYGHFNPFNRPVVSTEVQGTQWPFTPDTCEVSDDPHHTEWILNGTTLVCVGCGLDCT